MEMVKKGGRMKTEWEEGMEIVERKITIDPELSALIPPLTGDEYTLLEESILAEGCRDALIVWQGILIDGHNRYKICREHGLSFRVEEARVSSRAEAMAWMAKNQLGRRNLNNFQRAELALVYKPAIEAEARRRQATSTGGSSPQLRPTLDKAEPVDTKKELAEMANISHGTIAKAMKIKEHANKETLQALRAGDVSINQAYKEIRAAEKKQAWKEKKKQLVLAAEEVSFPAAPTKRKTVSRGDWWRLGDHLLYCGDTWESDFRYAANGAALAFADPPYNAGSAEWDRNFKWRHDWIVDKCKVAVVTPGIVSIAEFFKITEMPYKWSVSCWVKNGSARGALGFGNWIYAAIFSHEGVYRNSQDFYQIALLAAENDDTKHKGRKPYEFVGWLIELFSSPGDVVCDPFLGSGTTLLMAEKLGRKCIGGEIVPEFCEEIIKRWEEVTGKEAVRIDDPI